MGEWPVKPYYKRDLAMGYAPDITPVAADVYKRQDLYGDKQMSQPSRAILCAFGVGLTCGSIATNFSKTHFYAPVNKK